MGSVVHSIGKTIGSIFGGGDDNNPPPPLPAPPPLPPPPQPLAAPPKPPAAPTMQNSAVSLAQKAQDEYQLGALGKAATIFTSPTGLSAAQMRVGLVEDRPTPSLFQQAPQVAAQPVSPPTPIQTPSPSVTTPTPLPAPVTAPKPVQAAPAPSAVQFATAGAAQAAGYGAPLSSMGLAGLNAGLVAGAKVTADRAAAEKAKTPEVKAAEKKAEASKVASLGLKSNGDPNKYRIGGRG